MILDPLVANKSRSPTALVLEDDLFQSKAMLFVLGKFGITTESVSSSVLFLQKIKTLRPDLSFVDLNLERAGVGFSVIQAVRNVLGPKPILIVCSANANEEAVAHAIDVGANDFIVKPFDRHLLAAKISRFIKTDELQGMVGPLFPLPEGGTLASVLIEYQIHEINGLGIKFCGKNLLPKGLAIRFGGTLIREISCRDEPQILTVDSCCPVRHSPNYSIEAPFDQTDLDLLVSIRRWLLKRNKNKPPDPKNKVCLELKTTVSL